MARPSDETRYETKESVADHLRGLSVGDLKRLERMARARAAGLVHLEWSDLLNEALSRMLSGSRRWPSGVPFLAFFAQTLRSLANEEWRQQFARPVVPLGSFEEGTASQRDFTSAEANAEADLFATQLLQRIDALFVDDAEVRSLMSGYELDETANQTMVRTGLSPREYDAARKRFRRAIQRLVEEENL